MVDHSRMYDRICELPDTARSMLVLLDEFPEATVQDWWLVFHVIGRRGKASLPPQWDDSQ